MIKKIVRIIKCFQVTHKVIDDFDHADNMIMTASSNWNEMTATKQMKN